jgi:hypothetical protein
LRTIPLLLLSLAAGCSSAPFSGGSKSGLPPEAVRTYAKAHGLPRDEARRELELYRDADYLKELRQEQTRPADQSPASAAGGAVAGK